MLIDKATGASIPDEKVELLAHQLRDDIFGAFEAQSARVRRIEQLKAEVECTKLDKKVPFKGASSIHLPLTMEILHTSHVLTRRVILGSSPMITAIPPMRMDKEIAIRISRELSNFVHLALLRGGIHRALEAASWAAAIGGTGIVRVSWQSEKSRAASRPQAMRQPFSGAVIEYVPRKDFFMFPAHSKTVDEAKGVGHQFWLRLSDLKARAKAGEYDEAAVEKVVGESIADTVRLQQVLGVSQSAASMKVSVQDLQDQQDRYVRLTELVMWWRPSESEPFSDWLVTYCPEASTVLRLMPYPYEHGRRCYIPVYWLRDHDNFDGISFAWLLRGLNEEMDAQHRQYIDANTININQSWGVSPHLYATLKGKKMQPGQTLPLDMPGAAQKLFETVPLPNIEASKILREEAERVSGVSPTLMGVPLSGRRTATEVSQFVESGSAKIDDIVRTIHGSEGPYGADGLREIADQVLRLYYQYYDDWFDDVTAPIWAESREVLLTPVTLVGAGQSISMLPEHMREIYKEMWLMFRDEPLLLAYPKGRLRLMNLVAQTSNAGTDWLPDEEKVEAGMQAGVGAPSPQDIGVSGEVPVGIMEGAPPEVGGPIAQGEGEIFV